ncbi:hypothetical protein ACO2JO_18475 [Leptospira interrogans]
MPIALLTAEQARQIALDFLSDRVSTIDPWCRNPGAASRLRDTCQVLWLDSYTPIYEFAFQDEQEEPSGFVFISGTRDVAPILDYSFTGRTMTERHDLGLKEILRKEDCSALSIRWFYFGPFDIVAEVLTTQRTILHARVGSQKLLTSQEPFRFQRTFNPSERVRQLWAGYDDTPYPPGSPIPGLRDCFMLHGCPSLYQQTCRAPAFGGSFTEPHGRNDCSDAGMCISGCVSVAWAVLASTYANLGYFNGAILNEDANYRHAWPTYGVNGKPPVAYDNIVEGYIWRLHDHMKTDCAGLTSGSSLQDAGYWFFQLWNQFVFFKDYQNINLGDMANLIRVNGQPLFTRADYAWHPPDPKLAGHAFVVTGYDQRDDHVLISMGWGDNHPDWWVPFHQLQQVVSYYVVSPLHDEALTLEGKGFDTFAHLTPPSPDDAASDRLVQDR